MPQLLVTNVFGRKKKHEHLVFFNDQAYVCGMAEDHVHPIMVAPLPPAPPPQIDPQTGQPIPQPPQAPLPPIVGDVDGHTHTLLALATEDTTPTIPNESDGEILDEKYRQFRTAYDFETDSRDEGHESVDFRMGKQWDSSVLDKLGDSRAALVFNHTASMIDTLSGYFRQNKSDIRYIPVGEGTDSAVAEMLFHVTKNILDQNSFEMEEVDIFEDEIVPGRGFFEIGPNYDEDPLGKLKVNFFPWDQAVLGPHRRKDAVDLEYLFKWEWMSEKKLTKMYPELKDEISAAFSSVENTQVSDYSGHDTNLTNFYDPLIYDQNQKAFRFLDCEEKVYEKIVLWVDLDSEYIVNAKAVPQRLRKQLKTLNLTKRERTIHNLRRTQFVGPIVISDEYMDWPTLRGETGPNFSLIPVYAYKQGNEFYGKVRDAKDPQREINKRRSQIADQANMCVSNGWFYDPNTFSSPSQKRNFINNASNPGFVIEVANIQNAPVKVERDQISQSLIQLEMDSVRGFREVTNVRSEMMGASQGANESGVALLHKQKLGLVGNEFLFDNYWRGKKQLGRQLIGWVQHLYSAKQILRLLLDRNSQTPVDPQLLIAMEQQIQDVLDRKDLLQYDVAVAESGLSPTARTAMFGLLLDAATHGLPIPMESLLEMSDIPNKSKIIQTVQAQQQAAAAAEAKKYDVELEKTKIAHAGKGGESTPAMGSPMQSMNAPAPGMQPGM